MEIYIYLYDSNSFNLYKIAVTGSRATYLVIGLDEKEIVSTNVKKG
ncbi:hypothetical protein [Thalassobellus suaedae]|uniref:Uncharacterized protein n=1 Tax=Thalassobellus suaedae TaxID=3074124 RepID=A0ABY9XYZ2_9FLAO|nr:hypothetical protein RHP49_09650 [Flavobacteriaceae bacterium HL-DH10]